MIAAEARSLDKSLVVEVPLLFEVGWEADFEHVISVYAPRHVSLARVSSRDGVSQSQVSSILDIQLSAEEKAARSDSVIDNSGIWGSTVLQVSHLAFALQEAGQVEKSEPVSALKA